LVGQLLCPLLRRRRVDVPEGGGNGEAEQVGGVPP
jgi:hypothetical protein